MQPVDHVQPGWRAFLPETAILVAAVLYGSTFVLVQNALDRTTPSGFNTIRFAIGALALLPLALTRGWRGPHPRPTDSSTTMLIAGVVIGFIAWVAFVTQNMGLERTTTSNSAFVTGLFAVFTPFIEAAAYRRWPRRATLVAVPIAMVGLFLLTGAQLRGINLGDLITLVTALFWGIWFVVISEYVPRFNIFAIVCVEMATISLISAPIAIVQGFGTVDHQVWVAAVFTGLACSALAFSLSSWAQRLVEPSRASIINLFEPVVAGFVGYSVGERLGIGGYAGALLILAAILVAESGSWKATHPDETKVALPPTVSQRENPRAGPRR